MNKDSDLRFTMHSNIRKHNTIREKNPAMNSDNPTPKPLTKQAKPVTDASPNAMFDDARKVNLRKRVKVSQQQTIHQSLNSDIAAEKMDPRQRPKQQRQPKQPRKPFENPFKKLANTVFIQRLMRVPLMNYLWLGLSLCIVIIDQVTKYIAELKLLTDNQYRLFSWFNFHLFYNEGAAFSFLADMGGWQKPMLAFISLVVSIVITVMLIRTPRYQRLYPMALSLVLGGAVGNLIDRATTGRVVDFISVHYQDMYFFPAFNIADSAISVGAALLIIELLFYKKKAAIPAANTPTASVASEADKEDQFINDFSEIEDLFDKEWQDEQR